MTIKSRIEKAKKQSVVETSFPKVAVSHWGQRSASDPAVNYQQKVTCTGKDKIEDVEFVKFSVECHKAVEVGMPQPACEGNSNGTVCYHSMAAVMAAAARKGQVLSLFDKFSTAVNYSQLGGKLVKILSAQGDGKAWGVVRPSVKASKAQLLKVNPFGGPEDEPEMRIEQPVKTSFTARVNLLRGEIEKGIE